MLLAVEWTPADVTSLISAVTTGILAIIGAVTAYLIKRQTNRAEGKIDGIVVVAKQNADTLRGQNVVLADQAAKIDDITQSVSPPSGQR